MYYNIALGVEKNFYFLLEKIIQCGDGVRIPEPVENVDEIQFLIHIWYMWDNK